MCLCELLPWGLVQVNVMLSASYKRFCSEFTLSESTIPCSLQVWDASLQGKWRKWPQLSVLWASSSSHWLEECSLQHFSGTWKITFWQCYSLRWTAWIIKPNRRGQGGRINVVYSMFIHGSSRGLLAPHSVPLVDSDENWDRIRFNSSPGLNSILRRNQICIAFQCSNTTIIKVICVLLFNRHGSGAYTSF